MSHTFEGNNGVRVAQREPSVPFSHLDTVWIQLTGTVCNIACKHCFIGCGPKVTRHAIMSSDDVLYRLAEASAAGARHIWFTGGEPMLHPNFLALCEATLERFPLGVLTNGMRIDSDAASELSRLFFNANYNLEVRVSLDGATRESNDRIRGAGVFDATCRGISELARAGVSPVVAVAAVDGQSSGDREAFLTLLRELGVRRPRVRWIPPFRIGREATRRGGRSYIPSERIHAAEIDEAPDAAFRLQCGTSRTITSEGVFACPILIDEAAFRLGNTLAESLKGHHVNHGACHTCWVQGFSCSA